MRATVSDTSRDRALTSDPSSGDWIVVDVEDTGIGMTDDQVARLFTQLMQVDTSTTRAYGGTGLGLAIGQRLCRLMGGAITVRSQAGQGSTFTLRLPATLPGALRRAVPPGAAAT